MKKKILMTGISSFTGAHIAKVLNSCGHEVWGVLTQPASAYKSPLSRARIQYGTLNNLIDQAPLNSQRLRNHFQESQYDVFINHGWPVAGHNQPLSWHKEFISNTVGDWETLFDSLQISNKNMHIIHSGTVFEAGEGGNKTNPAVNDYGLIKSFVWDKILDLSRKRNFKLSKIIIPNPIGLLENPKKLISSFINEWKIGKTPVLNRPLDKFDNISVESMAQVYLKKVESDLPTIERPSGLICRNEELIDLVIKILNQDFIYLKKESNEIPTIERVNSINPQTRKDLPEDTKRWVISLLQD